MTEPLNANGYIQALHPLSLEEKQAEYYHCREKASAAVVLHDLELAEYYLKVLAYLAKYIIVEETLDIPHRYRANF